MKYSNFYKIYSMPMWKLRALETALDLMLTKRYMSYHWIRRPVFFLFLTNK